MYRKVATIISELRGESEHFRKIGQHGLSAGPFSPTRHRRIDSIRILSTNKAAGRIATTIANGIYSSAGNRVANRMSDKTAKRVAIFGFVYRSELCYGVSRTDSAIKIGSF